MNKIIIVIALLLPSYLWAQDIVPAVYTNIKLNGEQGLEVNINGKILKEKGLEESSFYNLASLMGAPKGTADGFSFNFNNKDFEGDLYIGLINYNDYKFPHPVYFKKISKIKEGRTTVNMNKLRGKYDMSDWETKKRGTLGYRVMNNKGEILYDGIISFQKKKVFEVLPTVIEGPILSSQTDSSIVLSYVTNFDAFSEIHVNDAVFKEMKACQKHEIKVVNLKANKEYEYELHIAGNIFKYTLKTAPKNGSRIPFTFAYVSDSRAGIGGGERNIYGVNAYILKKAMALSVQQNSAFMQFSGDLINGYTNSKQKSEFEYANFKNVISPFAAYMPFNASIGNHEITGQQFPDGDAYGVSLDGFPFETESMEAIFASQFANPQNGPESEDGKAYDPNPNKIDFPSYKENVYYYCYDNVAVIVLNSEYLYTPSLKKYPETSGGLHGYMMDAQLDWLDQTILKLEKDKAIDHIFITQHTPAFPNGGHVHNAMWYNGNNKHRTIIAGKKLKKGIIEQRDRYLDIIVNKSSKVRAILTGDEHNYCKTQISNDMPRYPEAYELEKLNLKRSIYQINNGACGAPYYAQDKTMPWYKFTSGFSTQNALVLFDVNAHKIHVRVVNPDTLEEIEHYDLN